MNAPIPVVVLTGFLGAGKTTLLRRLLGLPHGLRIGLVQNELGQAGIDTDAPAQSVMVELTEGCVCCLRNPDLLQALGAMWERGDLDRIVVETTGLADPLALTWTLARPELRRRIRLDSVVTVVDPGNFEAAAGEEWEAQVRCADLVVLSKLDCASPEQVRRATEAVRRYNERARILEGDERLPAGILLDSVPAREAAPAAPVHDHGHHSDFGVVSFAGPEVFALDPLEDLLEDLPAPVFRAKGIARVEEGGWVAFHVVGGRAQVDLRAPAPAHGESRFVFFGRRLERGDLQERLARCRAPASGG